jgi:ankyrin repeat protein
MTDFLLTHKANVNDQDQAGETPLHMAAISGSKEVAEVLLANNAQVSSKDGDDRTPFDLAVQKDHMDVADLLRQHGGHE